MTVDTSFAQFWNIGIDDIFECFMMVFNLSVGCIGLCGFNIQPIDSSIIKHSNLSFIPILKTHQGKLIHMI